MRRTGSYRPDFCPPAGYSSQFWYYYSTSIKGFQTILFAGPYPADRNAPNTKFTTTLLRPYRPLRRNPQRRGSHQHSIYLGSALSSDAPCLFGSSSCHKPQRFHANLFQASSTCQWYSTAYTPLNTNTIQNTSLPTKCLRRADLQYNYFLTPVIETLKDVYKFHPGMPLRYIWCGGI